jgi:phage shock protein A
MPDPVLQAIAALRADLDSLRADLMARLDRLQNALTLGREEQTVDQSVVLLMRRQIAHLSERIQAIEDRK